MSHTVPYLTTRPQSSSLYFRRGVPHHLRAHLGRREIFLSLETSDKREAARRCILTAAVVQKMFDTAGEKARRIASRRSNNDCDSVDEQNALEPLTKLRDYLLDDELFVEPLQSWMIPDTTGAVQHAMASLECVARDITNQHQLTLGDWVKANRGRIGAPLDKAIAGIWGFTSNRARHLSEGKECSNEEAELIVGFAAALGAYLSKMGT